MTLVADKWCHLYFTGYDKT